MANKPKYVYPQTHRQNETYMDEGGYGRTHIISLNKGGLELRDYFAAMAMQAEIAEYGGIPTKDEDKFEIVANSYAMADAMLKIREVENGDN